MSDNMENTETEVQTDAPVETAVAEERTYSQKEFDAAMAGVRRTSEERYAKRYEGIDIDEYRQMKAEKEAADQEKLKQRGEFDKAFQSAMEKKNAEIDALKATIRADKIDNALMSEASRNNAVNAKQMVALMKDSVRLSENGEVEVLDDSGAVRYTDNGTLMTLTEYVAEFATANPHFVRASQGGAGSKGAAGGSTQKPQSVAEMNANWNNGGREAYAAYRAGKR